MNQCEPPLRMDEYSEVSDPLVYRKLHLAGCWIRLEVSLVVVFSYGEEGGEAPHPNHVVFVKIFPSLLYVGFS